MFKEHFILEVLLEEDCTQEYEEIVGRKIDTPIIRVVAKVDCCESIETTITYWYKPDWESVKAKRMYIA